MSEQDRLNQRQFAVIHEKLRELEAARPVIDLGGSGPHDPGMEARVARLEADVGHIQSDVTEIKGDIRELRKVLDTHFYMLFGALITATLGLATVMAKGFHWF